MKDIIEEYYSAQIRDKEADEWRTCVYGNSGTLKDAERNITEAKNSTDKQFFYRTVKVEVVAVAIVDSGSLY